MGAGKPHGTHRPFPAPCLQAAGATGHVREGVWQANKQLQQRCALLGSKGTQSGTCKVAAPPNARTMLADLCLYCMVHLLHCSVNDMDQQRLLGTVHAPSADWMRGKLLQGKPTHAVLCSTHPVVYICMHYSVCLKRSFHPALPLPQLWAWTLAGGRSRCSCRRGHLSCRPLMARPQKMAR